MSMAYDVFISHASEDKKALVEPLANFLVGLGANVWFDKLTLEPGDSLSRSIDRGLAQSRYGLVVLSKAFFEKPWPEYELRGLVSREIGKDKVIIPIWYGVTKDDVNAFSPPLGDKLALNASELSLAELAVQILKIIRPDIHDSLIRWLYWTNKLKNAERQYIKLSDLKPAPIRHETLPFSIKVRSKIIIHILGNVSGINLETFIENLQRDLRPSRELEIWEVIAAAFLDYVASHDLTHEQAKQVYRVLLRCSLGALSDEDIAEFPALDESEVYSIANTYIEIMREHPDAQHGR